MRRKRTAEEITFLHAVGITIARLRHAKGLTQIQLSERINSNQSTIWRYESGETMPDLLMLRKIALALDISISEIFDNIEELLQKGKK